FSQIQPLQLRTGKSYASSVSSRTQRERGLVDERSISDFHPVRRSNGSHLVRSATHLKNPFLSSRLGQTCIEPRLNQKRVLWLPSDLKRTISEQRLAFAAIVWPDGTPKRRNRCVGRPMRSQRKGDGEQFPNGMPAAK